MADCRIIRNRLGRYLDGELSEPERHTIEAHLKQCSRCKAVLQEMSDLSDLFKHGVPAPPIPSYLTGKIIAKAKEELDGNLPGWSFLLFWRNWSLSMRFAALGVATVACYIGLVIGNSSAPSTPRAGDEMKWIGMTSGEPIVTAYVGGAR
jgi:predicted anti-sigma-YlaC factor YlaD